MTNARQYWSKIPRPQQFAPAAAALRGLFEGRKASGTPDPHAGPDWLKHVPEAVRGLVKSHLPEGLMDFAAADRPAHATEPVLPEGARFLSANFSNQAGTRPYKLYIPSGYQGQPVPLIVMLHGCTQSPDDFAAGTAMNEAAEQQTCLVVYPGQTTNGHAHKCWKWFSAEDQQRGRGEPSLIAGITQQVMQDYSVDPTRVYVAGLSAGGAAAAVMADAYPDLYAAIGVHSGLACGSARDLPSAMAAMKRGGTGLRHDADASRRIIPTIVFHGDRDATVSPVNGDDVVAQATQGAGRQLEVTSGQSAGGQDYTRTVHTDEAGQVVAEQWVIHGAGHAWSGGRPAGSYTDPSGPDATAEMLRFFNQHRHPGS